MLQCVSLSKRQFRERLSVKSNLCIHNKMAPAYKLSYFDIRGLAEPIRFLLAYGGVKYEDNRISKEDWPGLKGDAPMGQMPLLERGGKTYHQNVAIARCIAKQVGLTGKDDWENLEIDAMVDTITDMRLHLTRAFKEENPELKQTMMETFINETFPRYYSKFEQWAVENNGYLVLGKLTWADVYFTALTEGIVGLTKVDLPAKYPNLAKLRNNVLSNANIKKWVESRPKTDM